MPFISKTSLAQFFQYCTDKQLSFAFYKLPGHKIATVIAQTKSTSKNTHKPSDRGFLFAPFQQSNTSDTVFIEPDIYTTENQLPKLNFALLNNGGKNTKYKKIKLNETNKTDFQKYVKRIRKEIKKEKFSKIVAARWLLIKKPVTFSPVAYFKKLCKKYPSAFVSLVYTKSIWFVDWRLARNFAPWQITIVLKLMLLQELKLILRQMLKSHGG